MMVAYETWNYRRRTFDEALLNQRYADIEHRVVQLATSPSVAASCLFSIDEVPYEDDVLRVSLNVLPLSVFHSVAIFSFTKSEAQLADLALARVFHTTGEQQKYELSKLLLERMENFALNPQRVSSWSGHKLDTIKSAYRATLLVNGIQDHPELMLF